MQKRYISPIGWVVQADSPADIRLIACTISGSPPGCKPVLRKPWSAQRSAGTRLNSRRFG